MTASQKVSFWYCDKCNRKLDHGELRYNCTICDDFDYCENCATTSNSPHPHKMVPELAYGPAEKKMSRMKGTAALIRAAMTMFCDRHCMGTRDIYKNSYSWITFKTIGDRTKNFGHGLRRLIEPRAYLGICAGNRPEWIITDFACILQSIISVPIYTLFTDREIAYVINNTQISVIVCDQNMLERFVALHSQCPTLRHIICMDPIPDTISQVTEGNDICIHYMGDIEKYGATNLYSYVSTKHEDCLTIIYTSGSSGFPKGAIISQNTFRASFPRRCPSSAPDYIHFSYRPLAWAADRDAIIATFLHGGRTGFSTGDPSRLMEELALVRPSDFPAAPAIWNKLYTEYTTALALVSVNSPPDTIASEEQRLLQQFSKLIPNRCKIITTGGALTSSAVLDFMKRCFTHCSVNESYGITECGGIADNNQFDYDLQYRLESVVDMGYTLDDKPYSRGELLVKTNQMFSGYINNPDETHAAITEDGFFRTGDIVELQTDQSSLPHIRVIDRKKNFFKLSQGQFVSPEYLQTIYIQSPFVEQIYIHGDLLSDSVSAVIVPNQQYAQAFALQHSLTLLNMNNSHPLFHQAILQDLQTIAKKESLRKHEIPSHIIIDFQAFTPENGLLTSSMKPCRHKLATYYADQLKTSNRIEEKLKTIIKTITGQSILSNTGENVFVNTGNDSLSSVRLSRMIENDLGISLPSNILYHPQLNLQQLTNLIQNPSQISSFSKQTIQSQLINDSQLDLNITTTSHKSIASINHPSKIFITGTTGFVGAFVLSELLTTYSSKCQFVCLVRCNNENPFDRIKNNMIFYKIWKDEYKQQILPLKGDLTKFHFDLNDEIYNQLHDDIDMIYHCGANVNFILSYNQLYPANVVGTKEMITFACFNPSTCIPIQYISTISVMSNHLDFNQQISIDNISPNKLVNGYAQSKWVAEKLIQKAIDCGLSVNIYRLGLICADSRTGACNQHDFYTLLFHEIMKIHCYPQSMISYHFDGLPVDFTAKIIVHLSNNNNQDNKYGNIYHLINKNCEIKCEEIIDGMKECGIEIEGIDDNEWKMKMKTTENGELFVGNIFGERNGESNEKMNNDVCGLECPSVDKEYIMKWLDFILNNISKL
ncbi:unnamed protein product [Adineta steineri]|uniref:long-chain-fatty-acid--CoA ligase n=1 Tax=Adineta steineri TaxID=433720 RepID=A0A813WGL4_9BILA|nr:unnamed protein product [Adineta steineri]CAF1198104.1 unnamed protein product [Adineta steineri]